MCKLASITINGIRLTNTQAQIIRMSVEAFTAVMAREVEEKDEGVIQARTEEYLEALISVQKLLDILSDVVSVPCRID